MTSIRVFSSHSLGDHGRGSIGHGDKADYGSQLRREEHFAQIRISNKRQ